MRLPFLGGDSDEELGAGLYSHRRESRHNQYRDDDENWNPCFGVCVAYFIADGFGGRCCGIVGISVFLLVSVWIGITRNLYCNPEALRGVEAPFGGDLLPPNFTLVERKYWIQFTKLVDVYTENLTWVGYFYDINLLVLMRFGFSDPHGRIWFEARYASLFSRIKPWIEYDLQRCDSGDGKSSEVYQLREVWLEEIVARFRHQFCLVNCVRLFDIAKRKTDWHVMEGVIPPPDFAQQPIIRVRFDSTINPVISYLNGPSARHAWWMLARRSHHGPVVGFAQERFFLGDIWNQLRVISRWHAWSNATDKVVPTWVVAYMAVLDNVEEG